MTTVAFRDGVLAADSMSTCNEWTLDDNQRKVWSTNGILIAVTGLSAGAMPKVARLMNIYGERGMLKGDEVEIIDGQRLVVVTREHGESVIRSYECGGTVVVDQEFFAFGSGSPVAMAAMLMGADAAKAVEIAIRLDPYTGGTVQTVRF